MLDYDIEIESQEKARNKSAEIHALLVGAFSTKLGQKALLHLAEIFVNRPIYIQGQSIEVTAYRQGQADLVKQIQKEISNGRSTVTDDS